MAGRGILDADMATLGGWIRQGFAWWIEELRGMVPAGLQRSSRGVADFIVWRGPGDWDVIGTAARKAVLVDPALCLLREVTLPPLGESDLRRLIALDADRILPMPAALLIVGARADPADRSRVTVAAMPRFAAEAMLAELAGAGVAAAQVGVADPALPGHIAVDLSRALAEAGLLAPARQAAAGWWALAAFLFALNIGLLIWRDAEEVSRLEALVAEQAPAVNAARTITGRIARNGAQARGLAERREQQNALAVLGGITAALPAQAWVQRFSWDGRVIRLSGYKRGGVDVIGALRKLPWLADVRAADSDASAEVPTGQPFDVTATLRGRVR